jgi:hypothetical protein
MTSRPDASVIVALNPHDNDPARVFDAYLRQTARLESFEVVVVNGGARDTAAQAFAKHRRAFPATPVRLIEIEKRGRSAANNPRAAQHLSARRDDSSSRRTFTPTEFPAISPGDGCRLDGFVDERATTRSCGWKTAVVCSPCRFAGLRTFSYRAMRL